MGHKVIRCDVCGSYVMEGHNRWDCDVCGAECSENTGWKFIKKVFYVS